MKYGKKPYTQPEYLNMVLMRTRVLRKKCIGRIGLENKVRYKNHLLVGSGDGAVGITPVSISCLIKPRMRFSHTRLTDNLLSAAFKVHNLHHLTGKIFLCR